MDQVKQANAKESKQTREEVCERIKEEWEKKQREIISAYTQRSNKLTAEAWQKMLRALDETSQKEVMAEYIHRRAELNAESAKQLNVSMLAIICAGLATLHIPDSSESEKINVGVEKGDVPPILKLSLINFEVFVREMRVVQQAFSQTNGMDAYINELSASRGRLNASAVWVDKELDKIGKKDTVKSAGDREAKNAESDPLGENENRAEEQAMPPAAPRNQGWLAKFWNFFSWS